MNRFAKARLRQRVKDVKAGLLPMRTSPARPRRIAGTLTLFRSAAKAE